MTIDQHSGQSTNNQPEPDSALVHQVLAGEENAFEVLFAKYNEMLIYSILKRIRASGLTMEDAESLAADTWMKALIELKNYDPIRSPFSYWLINLMAGRTVLDCLRKKVRRDQIRDSLRPIPNHDGIFVFNIENKLYKIMLVDRALQSLNDTERLIVIAFFIERKTVAEVAEEFQLTEGQTRGRIARAKKKMRENLDPPSIDASTS